MTIKEKKGFNKISNLKKIVLLSFLILLFTGCISNPRRRRSEIRVSHKRGYIVRASIKYKYVMHKNHHHRYYHRNCQCSYCRAKIFLIRELYKGAQIRKFNERIKYKEKDKVENRNGKTNKKFDHKVYRKRYFREKNKYYQRNPLG